MVVVASIWEEGWFEPKTESNLWYYPLTDFAVDEIAFTPVFDINIPTIKQFHSVEEIIQHYGLPVIVCEERGETILKDFVHPENALYIFNRTSGAVIPGKHDYSLRVETNKNKAMLWGHQAASIILYDRFIKHGNNNKR